MHTESSVLTIDLERHGDILLTLTSDAVHEQRQRVEELHGQWLSTSSPGAEHVTVEDIVPGGDIQFRVSSAIMIRKSPVFAIWLQENSCHGKQLNRNGIVEFVDEDIDPPALSYLLHFIYDKYDDCPGFGSDLRVTFHQFVEALVIIDKWDLHKATHLLKREWWTYFCQTIPDSVENYIGRQRQGEGLDLRAWISLTHMLGKRVELNKLLAVYKFCSTGFSNAQYDLPLPEKLQNAEYQRLDAIKAVNDMLLAYSRSASGHSLESICKCNDIQVARICDRAALEVLEKNFRRSGWTTSAARGRHGSSAPAQLDPQKVTFQDIRCAIPKMKHFPHHCAARAKRIAEDARIQQELELEKLKMEQAKQQASQQAQQRAMSIGNPFMGSDLTNVDSWLEMPGISFNRAVSPTALTSGSGGPPASLRTPRLRCRRNPTASRVTCPMQRPLDSVLSNLLQTGSVADQVQQLQPYRFGQHDMQPSFRQVPPSGTYPWPMSTFSLGPPPSATPQCKIHQQPTYPAARVHTAPQPRHIRQMPMVANPMSFHSILSSHSLTTSPIDFDFDFGISDFANLMNQSSGDFVDPGQVPHHPIDVDSYQPQSDGQQPSIGPPQQLEPCNPSPYQKICLRMQEIEDDLGKDVPDWKQPIFL